MKEGDIISIAVTRDKNDPLIEATDLDIGIHKLYDKKYVRKLDRQYETDKFNYGENKETLHSIEQEYQKKKNALQKQKNFKEQIDFRRTSGFGNVNDVEIIKITRNLIMRTYATIKSFLDYSTNEKCTLWESPPIPIDTVISHGFNAFRGTIEWPRLIDGCEKFMKIRRAILTDRVRNRISLMIYLTISGLLQKKLAVKPYAYDEDARGKVVGFVKRVPEENGGTLFEKLHPYSTTFNLSNYCTYFEKTYDHTLLNFNTFSDKHDKLVIHLETEFLTQYPETLAVLSMIHEASHKFAATKDVFYFDKSDTSSLCSGTSEMYKIKLKWGQNDYGVFEACKANGCSPEELAYTYNADSVAALIYHYGNR